MSKVVFIELPVARKNRYICEITEKFHEEGKTVHIFTRSKETALQLSRDLWVWKPDSFIPHATYFGGDQTSEIFEEPVVITTRELDSKADALILEEPLEPELVRHYEIIVDFAEVYDEKRKVASRKRYKAFRDSEGFEVGFTKIGAFLKQGVNGD